MWDFPRVIAFHEQQQAFRGFHGDQTIRNQKVWQFCRNCSSLRLYLELVPVRRDKGAELEWES